MSPRRFLSAAAQQFASLVRHTLVGLERKRRSQLIAVVAVSVVCAAIVAEATVSARHSRQSWSVDVPVLVATTDIDKGDVLTPLNSHMQNMPRAVIPADALTSRPHRATTRVALQANTLLSGSVIVPAREAVTVPDGWRVVALPGDTFPPDLVPGDRVDIVVGTSVVAVDCVVLNTEPLSVAVPPDAVPAVAAGARLDDISVVARP